MSDYTPSTGEVRRRYAYARSAGNKNQSAVAEFDRWLAAHDAEKRAEWEVEEPGWETEHQYRIRPSDWFPIDDSTFYPAGAERRTRRVTPWVPAKQEGADDVRA
ncbi:hypothetical protein [uncultured Microbacterium sp.]|uniref:hypothetical protein n=1 Tax=uncultured Microbacterium sp. TaxID=191216 RepID=UPI0025F46E5B|nr:hypothetical protein [uncultured Microbacterium sp.]